MYRIQAHTNAQLFLLAYNYIYLLVRPHDVLRETRARDDDVDAVINYKKLLET